MRLNSKVTGGLAWAGLVLVLAVPSADMLTQPSAKTATVTSGMDATETASITPVVKPVVPAVKPVVPAAKPVASATSKPTGTDVVEEYISSGKKLPSYISDAPAAAAQEPATKPLVVPTSPVTAAVTPGGDFADDETQVASVAPVPYPASMRPRPAATAALPAGDEAPLILDEEAVSQREATLRAVEPVLADEPDYIDEQQLDEWDSGSLADYLERKGLISEAEQAQPVDSDYDPDGFFLSDGPNRSKARVIRRVNDDVDFFLF